MTSVWGELKRCNIVTIVVAIAILKFFLIGIAEAQDLDPRRYVNLPVDQNFLRIAYGYSEGDVNIAPSLPLEDAILTIEGGSLAYLRTMGIGGNASSFDVWLPYLCASGSAELGGERRNREHRARRQFLHQPAPRRDQRQGRIEREDVGQARGGVLTDAVTQQGFRRTGRPSGH